MDREYIILDKNAEEQIVSIQRTSDGAVFNLGDEIINVNSSFIDNIKGIYVSENHVAFVNIGGTSTVLLKNIALAEKVLFKTDGARPIFEGDIYYVLTGENMYNSKGDFVEIVRRVAKKGDGKYSYKRFSSEKAALDYLIKNKKCLDIKTIRTKLLRHRRPSMFGPGANTFTLDEIMNILEDVVENKIKITYS